MKGNKLVHHLNNFPKNKIRIKTIFKIIGAAEAAANLLCEFKIAEKNEDKLTNIKKGNVILVKSIANFNFSLSVNKTWSN